jgi:hypothetical protein
VIRDKVQTCYDRTIRDFRNEPSMRETDDSATVRELEVCRALPEGGVDDFGQRLDFGSRQIYCLGSLFLNVNTIWKWVATPELMAHSDRYPSEKALLIVLAMRAPARYIHYKDIKRLLVRT